MLALGLILSKFLIHKSASQWEKQKELRSPILDFEKRDKKILDIDSGIVY
jgi:hypothetical protein